MARPKKDAPIDLTQPHALTVGLIERVVCPVGKQQVFLRDSKAPGLRVRVTAAGAKSFVFEAKLCGKTIRRTIGDVRAWPLGSSDAGADLTPSTRSARAEANRLRVMLDTGTDPRELERQQEADKIAQTAADIANALTVGDLWPRYLAEGHPKKRVAWKPRYRADI